MKEKELERALIKLWSGNSADYIDNIRRELPKIVAALQVKPRTELEDIAIKFDQRASDWDRTVTDGNKLAAAECRLFAQTLRSLLSPSAQNDVAQPDKKLADAQNVRPEEKNARGLR